MNAVAVVRAVPEPARDGAALERGASVLADAWNLRLLAELGQGPRRFSQLERATRMAPRVLSRRLRELGQAGVVARVHYPEIPPRVEYALTDAGQDAYAVAEAVRAFGARWLSDNES